MSSRPDYLTKAIAGIKDPPVREIVRECDRYISDQASLRLCTYINKLQDRVKELESMVIARGGRV